jgi:hypothetical protein
MTNKKILVVGASENDVIDANRTYHYITLLREFADITNISIGGMSNDEIFYRTTFELVDSEYDGVIVLWSSIDRKWAYLANNNIDDFTRINGTAEPSGFNHKLSAVRQYQQLHYAYFNNQYVMLKHWLSQIILFQTYLKEKNMPTIMIHDFENFISDLINFQYSDSEGFSNISDDFKAILDFDNRNNEHILKKINELTLLVNKINQQDWIDFKNYRFSTAKVDFCSNSNRHAGPQSHQKFFNILVPELQKRNMV